MKTVISTIFLSLVLSQPTFAVDLAEKVAELEATVAKLTDLLEKQQAMLMRVEEQSDNISKLFGEHGSKWIIEPQTGVPVQYKARYIRRYTPGGTMVMELIEDDRGPHPIGSIVHEGGKNPISKPPEAPTVSDMIQRGVQRRSLRQ